MPAIQYEQYTDTLLVHRPVSPAKQRRDSAISVAAILTGKLDDVGSQRGCPSSGNLRLIRHFKLRGSGSSGVRV